MPPEKEEQRTSTTLPVTVDETRVCIGVCLTHTVPPGLQQITNQGLAPILMRCRYRLQPREKAPAPESWGTVTHPKRFTPQTRGSSVEQLRGRSRFRFPSTRDAFDQQISSPPFHFETMGSSRTMIISSIEPFTAKPIFGTPKRHPTSTAFSFKKHSGVVR